MVRCTANHRHSVFGCPLVACEHLDQRPRSPWSDSLHDRPVMSDGRWAMGDGAACGTDSGETSVGGIHSSRVGRDASSCQAGNPRVLRGVGHGMGVGETQQEGPAIVRWFVVKDSCSRLERAGRATVAQDRVEPQEWGPATSRLFTRRTVHHAAAGCRVQGAQCLLAQTSYFRTVYRTIQAALESIHAGSTKDPCLW